MATAYSSNLALALPVTGELSGTWGTTVNTQITNMLDEALGYQVFSATGGADTLTIPDGTTGVARSIFIQLNGTGGGSVAVPTAKTKMYFVFNNTSSAITFKVTGQTGVSIPAAGKMALVSNGTDIIVAQNYFSALTLGAALPVASGGTGITSFGTGVATALGVNTGTAGAFVVNGGALGSPSTAGTIPAFTLGGTVSGGGNNINNVIIGASTPLAGSFTTLSATGNVTITSSEATVVLTTTAQKSYLLISGGGGNLANGYFAIRNSTNGNNPFYIDPAAPANCVYISSTGLAVTGTLSATKATTGDVITWTATGSRTGYLYADATYIALMDIGGAGAGNGFLISSTNTSFQRGGATIANVSSTALALGVGISLTGGTSGTGYSFSGSAPATSLTLDSSGNLGVGTPTPGAKLDVVGNIRARGSATPTLTFNDGTIEDTISINSSALQLSVPSANPITFLTTNTERARIPSTGGIQSVNSISVGNATPSTSGAGITFPATQSASTDANTLDDYEEGTWTPSVGGTATYTSQVGRYTKVGRLVTFQSSLTILLIGTGSTTQISGLPFGGAAFNSANGGHAIYYDTIDSSVSQIVGYIGTTNIILQSTTVFANSIGSYAIFKNGATLTFQGFYFV